MQTATALLIRDPIVSGPLVPPDHIAPSVKAPHVEIAPLGVVGARLHVVVSKQAVEHDGVPLLGLDTQTTGAIAKVGHGPVIARKGEDCLASLFDVGQKEEDGYEAVGPGRLYEPTACGGESVSTPSDGCVNRQRHRDGTAPRDPARKREGGISRFMMRGSPVYVRVEVVVVRVIVLPLGIMEDLHGHVQGWQSLHDE